MRPIFLCTAPLILSLACDAATTAQVDVQADSAAAVQSPAVAVDGEAAVAGAGEAVIVSDTVVAGDAKIELAVDAFKLDRVTTLVQSGEIETAEELELAVNDPTAEINRIDIDADGTVDHVEVVEVRGDSRVDFELKVIPSSRATITHAVNLATASVVATRATSEVAFNASFSAGVSFTGGAAFSANADALAFVAPATFEASAVVVAQPLLAWCFVAERPVYASIYIEANSGKWIPPGHVKHGLWKLTGDKPGHGRGHGKFSADASVDFDGHGHDHGHGKFHGDSKHDDHGPSSKPNKHESKSSPGKSEARDSGPKGNSSKGHSDGGAKGNGGSKGGGGGGGGGGGSKGGGGKGKHK